jgi:hypothetical protein
VCLQLPFAPPFLVGVSAEGFATRETEIAEDGDIALELDPEVPFKVVTRTAEGSPVAGARVIVLAGASERRREIAVSSDSTRETREDGSAEFTGFGVGNYRLVIEHPDFIRVEQEVELKPESGAIAVSLDRGAHLIVKVIDASSQQPMPDSQVQADPRGVPINRALQCVTGADGTCELTGLPVGRYTIHAEHSAFARAHETFVVGPDAAPAAVLRLSRAVAITGRVIGTDRYPGTKLQVEVAKPGVPVVYAPVGSGGEFRVSEAPTGDVSFWVTEPSVDSTLMHRLVAIPAGADNFRVDLEIPVPVQIAGLILDSAGAGCGSCLLEFERVSGEYATTLHRAKVNRDGQYEARLSIAGPYVARVRDSISGVTAVEQIDARGSSIERDFHLTKRTVEVRVREAGGTASADAVVMLHANGASLAEITTDSYGVARFIGVAVSSARITASRNGRTVSREVTFDQEKTILELTLGEAAPLRVAVVDSVSNLPIYSVDARVTGARGESVLRTSLIRDDAGVFTLPSFEGGSMTVVIEASGYAVRTIYGMGTTEAVQRVALTPRWRAFTVEVNPDSVTPCAIEVRDTTGRIIALSARIGAVPIPFTQRSAMFPGLDWGSYSVTLVDCSGRNLTKPLTLQQGGNSNVVFP